MPSQTKALDVLQIRFRGIVILHYGDYYTDDCSCMAVLM